MLDVSNFDNIPIQIRQEGKQRLWVHHEAGLNIENADKKWTPIIISRHIRFEGVSFDLW